MTKLFAATSPFELYTPAELQRTQGQSRISFKLSGGETRLDRLFQLGAAKVRFPRTARHENPEVVLINSAGGLTGGDRLSIGLELAPHTSAAVTTQTCERIYRALAGDAEVATTLRLGEGARLHWMPQETILFDGGRLTRRFNAEMAAGATLLAMEATIFGRAAHGETVKSGSFMDRWRIRRAGRLVFADDLRFEWTDEPLLQRPAVLGGAGAMATILLVGDEPERHLPAVRGFIGSSGGASAWNGKLLARVVAEGGAALRETMRPVLVELSGGTALPRNWLI
jgi:urease accessory protein